MPSAYKRKDSDFFWGKVKFRGKWKDYNTNCKTHKQALEHAQITQAQINMGGNPFNKSVSGGGEELDSTFEKYMTARKKSWADSTMINKAESRKKIVGFFGSVSADSIRQSDIDDFKAHLLASLADETVDIHLRNLRAFLNWCIDRDYATKKTKIELIEPDNSGEGEPDHFFDDEIPKLLSAADSMKFNGGGLGAVIRVFLNTGMRRNEVVNLSWEWIGLEGETPAISIPAHAIVDGVRRRITKNGKSRVIPIYGELKAVFEALGRKRSGRVFPYLTKDITHKFPDITKAAGVRDLNLHKCRDTFICKMIRAEMDPLLVATIAGNTLKVMVKYYVHLSKKEVLDKAFKTHIYYENATEKS